MGINFHDKKNAFTYATRDADVSWQQCIEKMTSIQGKHVLDIGCGGGIYTKKLLEMGAGSVTAVDSSSVMLQTTKAMCREYENVHYIVGDATKIPLEDEQFDIILSRAVIHHLPNIQAYFKEAYRLLKPSGLLITQDRTVDDCSLPGSEHHLRGFFFETFPHLVEKENMRRPSSAAILQWLQHTNFTNITEQKLWETRNVYTTKEALLHDLSLRTGRSILHELSDDEMNMLLHTISNKIKSEPITEQDRWTIWFAQK
ncbi:class I SAM-dependent methyltransferase [Priestia taiwanensis]|uniref:SAM-dependent methyltransferase n=1 Tax=Priestia taiwanensis TaxID=1347902 RepID=A0A917EQC1_9BACI|nr:class I SAM-dependent methyltransferase [Priestia taiwanensis]GGE72503.1 SAM-dependent methyltransferase [Priestia taiwanensis]